MSLREKLLLRFGPSLCGGMTLGDWLAILRENRFAVDPQHWPRALSITLATIQQSLLRRVEEARFGRQIDQVTVQPPIFVLGVWRSGTTHLQNMLAVDSRFAFPNYTQVLFPHSFLTAEGYYTWLLDRVMPRRRPQDNVPQGSREPAEDEVALALLTLRSFFFSWMFPRDGQFYERFLTFRGADSRDIERWKEGLLRFVKKMTLRYNRPIVLKSPGHTCRIRLLLELFPDARFVNIHRHPYDVYRSACHAARRVIPFWAMQAVDYAKAEEQVLTLTGEAYEVYFEERSLIPEDRLCEVRFESLESDPLGEMRRVYEQLNLPDFGVVESDLRAYLDSISGYRRNELPAPDSRARDKIQSAWPLCFERWGYAP